MDRKRVGALMAEANDEIYQDVPANSETVSDIVVPDGETWEVQAFIGNAAYLDDTVVCVIWDPVGVSKILGCTHGDAKIEPNFRVTGTAGGKVLRISLDNGTAAPRIMGASWVAKKIS